MAIDTARIISGWTTLHEDARGAVIGLGNFDGVHKGHRSVLARAQIIAQGLNTHWGAAVFTPHPRQWFAPEGAPFRLSSDAQRAHILWMLGADPIFHLPFDAQLASMEPEVFVKSVLVDGLGVRGVVTGADFCFGKGRAGNADTLAHLAGRYGFAYHALEPVMDDARGGEGEKVSSSMIREALREGDPRLARTLMGRPFTIEGVVAHGDKRGRLLGFPTANMALGDYVRPKFGVYAVHVYHPDRERPLNGVANLGARPTVEGTQERLEVHIFDFEGDLYDLTLEVALLDFIRPEQKFDGLEALKAQIAQDCTRARALLERR